MGNHERQGEICIYPRICDLIVGWSSILDFFSNTIHISRKKSPVTTWSPENDSNAPTGHAPKLDSLQIEDELDDEEEEEDGVSWKG